jgi:hypothetical protein
MVVLQAKLIEHQLMHTVVERVEMGVVAREHFLKLKDE